MDTKYKNLQKNMHKWIIKFKTQSIFEDALVQLLSYQWHWKKCCHKYSQPSGYQCIQDKNQSHGVIFLYWTHHQPRDINEEGCWIGRWNNYSIKNEVDLLGTNRGVRSVIVNLPVARSGTEVHKVWWRVQGLVTTPQFLPESGPTENQRPGMQNSTWRYWVQQASYEESDHNSTITPSRMSN
jgi:hypothetical protein